MKPNTRDACKQGDRPTPSGWGMEPNFTMASWALRVRGLPVWRWKEICPPFFGHRTSINLRSLELRDQVGTEFFGWVKVVDRFKLWQTLL